MVVFKNIVYDDFLEQYSDRSIILFGAGLFLSEILKFQRHKVELLSKIDYILDNDPAKQNKEYTIGLRVVSVMPVKELISRGVDLSRYVVMLCVCDENIIDVINHLDSIPEFDNVICLYGGTVRVWAKETYALPVAGRVYLPAPEKDYAIPKVIHYCRFGCGDLGAIEQECVESWKRFCPDFEIRRWSEENYDISKTPSYVQQAYSAKKYAFVSDYARLDIVYQNGGFYFDADALLLRSIDELTKYRAVYAYLTWNEINTGLGFGSVAGDEKLLGQMRLYEQLFFVNDGKMNLTPCPEYSTEYFRRSGMRIDNRLQLVDDILFLPSDFLCSLMPVFEANGQYYLSLYALTANSYAVHKCTSTWMESDVYASFDCAKSHFLNINERLLTDWKREYGEGGR